MNKKYLSLSGASGHYGGRPSAWRKWVANGSLGKAVCRFGRLVMVNTEIIDERLATTGQLLVKQSKLRNRATSAEISRDSPADPPYEYVEINAAPAGDDRWEASDDQGAK